MLRDHNGVKDCRVLPSLCEGAQKVRSLTENTLQILDLWSFKHGLATVNDYFIRILFASGDSAGEKWFPSDVVLRGPGLSPAPQATRIVNALSGLSNFLEIIEGWNFFGQGFSKVEVLSSFDIDSESFTWKKATNVATTAHSPIKKITNNDLSSLTDLFSVNDFRAPKPTHLIPTSNTALEKDETIDRRTVRAVSSERIKPTFSRSKMSGKKTPSDAINPSVPPEKEVASVNCEGTCNPEIDVPANAGTSYISEQFVKNSRGKSKGLSENEGRLAGDPSSLTQNSQKTDSIAVIKKMQSSDSVRVPGKSSAARGEKIKVDRKEAGAKRKPGKLTDQGGVSSKVLDCHSKGQLGSLTVAELKSFLIEKKAKVGGKKEDLILRVASLIC
ncbi:uncharacterized protein LOC144713464 isoform X2 [Wolffia australiana]